MWSLHKAPLLILGFIGVLWKGSVSAQPVAHVRLAAVRRPSESRAVTFPRWLALRDLTSALATDPTIAINTPGHPYADVTVAIESVTQETDWVVTASVRRYQTKPVPLEGRGASMTSAVQHLAEAVQQWLHEPRH